MIRNQFNTVSDDLLPFAESAVMYFRSKGYTVSIERQELGFPFTPTLKCVRQQTTLVVDLQSQILLERLSQWVAYCKSRNRDTRISVVLPETTAIKPEHEDKLREKGIGCYIAGEKNLTQKLPPRDLTISLTLPNLTELPRRLRQLLGHAYERFEESDTIDGFSEACTVLENECKLYLKRGIDLGRIKFISRSGPRTYTKSHINSRTMGQLLKLFEQIQNKNSVDNGLYQALERINPDRIKVSHERSRVSVGERLSRNATHNMWVIVQALKSIS